MRKNNLLQNFIYFSETPFSLRHEIEKAKLISQNINFKKMIFKLEDYKYLKGDILYLMNMRTLNIM